MEYLKLLHLKIIEINNFNPTKGSSDNQGKVCIWLVSDPSHHSLSRALMYLKVTRHSFIPTGEDASLSQGKHQAYYLIHPVPICTPRWRELVNLTVKVKCLAKEHYADTLHVTIGSSPDCLTCSPAHQPCPSTHHCSSTKVPQEFWSWPLNTKIFTRMPFLTVKSVFLAAMMLNEP